MKLKHTLCVLIALILLVGSVPAGLAVSPVGDIDGDGALTPDDARLALRGSVKLAELSDYQIAVGDIDRDGQITSADARLVLRLAVGLPNDSATTTDDIPDDSADRKPYASRYDNLIDEMRQRGMFDAVVGEPMPEEEKSALRAELNEILAQKQYADEINYRLTDILDGLCEYYGDWQRGYFDLPPADAYIRRYMLQPLRTVGPFTFTDINSEEGQKMLEIGFSLGYTTRDKDGKNMIGIIGEKKENVYGENIFGGTWEDELTVAGHELLGHVAHMDTFSSDNFYDEDDNDLYLLIEEGCATFHQRHVSPYSTESNGSWGAANSDRSLTIEYRNFDCMGYLYYLNTYEKLVFLLGHDTLAAAESGDIRYADIKQKLARYYGREEGALFADLLKKSYRMREEKPFDDNTYKICVGYENLFLYLAESNLKYIETAAELEKYEAVVNRYLERNLPKVTTKDYQDVTNDYFHVDHLLQAIRERAAQLAEE